MACSPQGWPQRGARACLCAAAARCCARRKCLTVLEPAAEASHRHRRPALHQRSARRAKSSAQAKGWLGSSCCRIGSSGTAAPRTRDSSGGACPRATPRRSQRRRAGPPRWQAASCPLPKGHRGLSFLVSGISISQCFGRTDRRNFSRCFYPVARIHSSYAMWEQTCPPTLFPVSSVRRKPESQGRHPANSYVSSLLSFPFVLSRRSPTSAVPSSSSPEAPPSWRVILAQTCGVFDISHNSR